MKYNELITKVERYETQLRYHVGDDFIICASKCDGFLNDRKSLMNLWKKHGYINKVLPTYISIQTYYTDADGNCSGRYNITHKKENGRTAINLDYLKEWNLEDVDWLVGECIALYLADKEAL